MAPWVLTLFSCAALSLAAYALMRFSIVNYIAAQTTASRLRKSIHAVLLALVWSVLATSPWLLAISIPASKSLLQSNGLFPLYLLACHVAAAYPAYRYFYRNRLTELIRSGAEPVSFWPGQVPAATAAAREETPFLVVVPAEAGAYSQPQIESMLQAIRLREILPASREIRVTLRGEVPEGARIADAHPNWRPGAVASLKALPPFPHRDAESPCPSGLVQLDVECVRRRSGGMGSHYGFEGHFFSVLARVADPDVFDARGEVAR